MLGGNEINVSSPTKLLCFRYANRGFKLRILEASYFVYKMYIIDPYPIMPTLIIFLRQFHLLLPPTPPAPPSRYVGICCITSAASASGSDNPADTS